VVLTKNDVLDQKVSMDDLNKQISNLEKVLIQNNQNFHVNHSFLDPSLI
jgi:hypothetical protein